MIKLLKRATGLLNRNEGSSLIAVIAFMIAMAVMGGVFSSIMGKWKLSSPSVVDSNRAFYLAETAAMFALQDASNRFFSKDATDYPIFPSSTSLAIGTRTSPFPVVNTTSEYAGYWIERPNPSGNPTVDLYPTGHPQAGNERGNNDDDDSSSDDDVVDDDVDDGDTSLNQYLYRYTITATGKTMNNGVAVATRQIKIKAVITDNSFSPIAPGVHTDGSIDGSGNNIGNCFGVYDPVSNKYVGYTSGTNNNIVDVPNDFLAELGSGIIYRTAPALDKGIFKAIAINQGHYHTSDLDIMNANDDYPNGSFDYTATMPNITYVEGSTNELKVNANRKAWGIYYVEGDVDLGGANSEIEGIVICEGNVTINGTATITGGIVHYGTTLNGNGSPATITLNAGFFSKLNEAIPVITVYSNEDAVSAN